MCVYAPRATATRGACHAAGQPVQGKRALLVHWGQRERLTRWNSITSRSPFLRGIVHDLPKPSHSLLAHTRGFWAAAQDSQGTQVLRRRQAASRARALATWQPMSTRTQRAAGTQHGPRDRDGLWHACACCGSMHACNHQHRCGRAPAAATKAASATSILDTMAVDGRGNDRKGSLLQALPRPLTLIDLLKATRSNIRGVMFIFHQVN